jgi:predicted kinase
MDDSTQTSGWTSRLLIICGTAATGKTRLAQELALLSGLPHLSSDVIHKELLGIAPTDHVPPHAHTDELSQRTYAELGRLARLANGAIVDATFRRRRDRDQFAEAYGGRAALFFIECRAPDIVLRARALKRLHEPGRTSDATFEVVEKQLNGFEPLDEVPPEKHVVVQTDRPIDDILAEVKIALRKASST